MFRSILFPVIIASGVVINILQTQVMMTAAGKARSGSIYVQHAEIYGNYRKLGMPVFISDLAVGLQAAFNITWKSEYRRCCGGHFRRAHEAAEIERTNAWEKLWKITSAGVADHISCYYLFNH